MTFSNEVIKILDDLGKRIGFVADWNAKNVMPYLKELMTRFIDWEVATSIVWIVIGITMLIVGIISTRYIWKNRDKYDYLGDPDVGISWLFLGVILLALIGLIVVIVQCFDICQAIYLPEATIYHYVNHLIHTPSN